LSPSHGPGGESPGTPAVAAPGPAPSAGCSGGDIIAGIRIIMIRVMSHRPGDMAYHDHHDRISGRPGFSHGHGPGQWPPGFASRAGRRRFTHGFEFLGAARRVAGRVGTLKSSSDSSESSAHRRLGDSEKSPAAGPGTRSHGTGSRPTPLPGEISESPDMGRALRVIAWTEPSNTSDVAPPVVPLWNRVPRTSGPGLVRY
jgi:hypothetical protein